MCHETALASVRIRRFAKAGLYSIPMTPFHGRGSVSSEYLLLISDTSVVSIAPCCATGWVAHTNTKTAAPANLSGLDTSEVHKHMPVTNVAPSKCKPAVYKRQILLQLRTSLAGCDFSMTYHPTMLILSNRVRGEPSWDSRRAMTVTRFTTPAAVMPLPVLWPSCPKRRSPLRKDVAAGLVRRCHTISRAGDEALLGTAGRRDCCGH